MTLDFAIAASVEDRDPQPEVATIPAPELEHRAYALHVLGEPVERSRACAREHHVVEEYRIQQAVAEPKHHDGAVGRRPRDGDVDVVVRIDAGGARESAGVGAEDVPVEQRQRRF
jgi:hypothetical protein